MPSRSPRHAVPILVLALCALLALTTVIAAEDGKALYGSKCAMCHGADGVAKPIAKGSRNFNDPAFQKEATADSIVKVASEGKGKMPAYEKSLGADKCKDLVAFVRTLKK